MLWWSLAPHGCPLAPHGYPLAPHGYPLAPEAAACMSHLMPWRQLHVTSDAPEAAACHI